MVGGGSPGGFGGVGSPDMNDPSSLKTPRDGNGLYNMLEALTGGNLDFELPLAALQEDTSTVLLWELHSQQSTKLDTNLKDLTLLMWSRAGPQLVRVSAALRYLLTAAVW